MNTGVLPKKIWDQIQIFEDSCWVWLGSPSGSGYGRVTWEGKREPAHRVIYKLLVGEIPDGLDLDHLCRNRTCVYPNHLDPVPRLVNLWRSPIFNGNRTHCPKGHLRTPENTCIQKRGRYEMKSCRECRRIKSQIRWHINQLKKICA